MAELDKKSEGGANVRQEDTDGERAADSDELVDSVRRNKKHDKLRNKDNRHHKKNTMKLLASPSKSGDSTRLRSSR